MFKGALIACALLGAFATAAAEELPVRDPMRPFGRTVAAVPGDSVVSAGPRFDLTAVIVSSARRVAVVNGKPYREGQSVDGAEIVRIELHAVHLREHGTEQVIPLGRPGKVRLPHSQGETAP